MEISLQETKIELIQWLTTLEDSSLLQKIQELRKADSKDWWDEITSEEKKSIEKGIADSKAGRVKPHSEARMVYEKWL